MRNKSLISIVIVCVFLSSGIAFAGFEPSPFIGQLGAVENILNSADDRISKVMSTEPSPFEPSPNLNGALNRLEAINSQLGSVGDMIFSIINEVMGFEPTPFIPAFTAVRNAAQSIVNNIDESTPFDPQFEDALVAVQSSANDIVLISQEYIDDPSGCGDVVCSDFEGNPECEASPCCVWVISTDGLSGLCNNVNPF